MEYRQTYYFCFQNFISVKNYLHCASLKFINLVLLSAFDMIKKSFAGEQQNPSHTLIYSSYVDCVITKAYKYNQFTDKFCYCLGKSIISWGETAVSSSQPPEQIEL